MPQLPCNLRATSSLARGLAAFLILGLNAAGTGRATELKAGAYSFSDELGGFRLLSASGTGTRDDPAVIVEEFDDVVPVTPTVRRLDLARGNAAGAEWPRLRAE